MDNTSLFIRLTSGINFCWRNSCCNFVTFFCFVFTCTGLCTVVAIYMYYTSKFSTLVVFSASYSAHVYIGFESNMVFVIFWVVVGIVYPRLFIKIQTSGTSSDNEWQQMTTSGKASDNGWQRVVQRVKTNGNELQRMTASCTTSDKEWKWVRKCDNEWKLETTSESSGTANENGTVHFKEWMIAIISMTKRDTLLLQGMDGCN